VVFGLGQKFCKKQFIPTNPKRGGKAVLKDTLDVAKKPL